MPEQKERKDKLVTVDRRMLNNIQSEFILATGSAKTQIASRSRLTMDAARQESDRMHFIHAYLHKHVA